MDLSKPLMRECTTFLSITAVVSCHGYELSLVIHCQPGLNWLTWFYMRYMYIPAADDCLDISAIAGKRHLRSAHTGMLSVPRTTTTLGMRSFAVAGPSHLEQFTSRSANCNSLPSDVRSTFEGPPVWLIGSASEDYL